MNGYCRDCDKHIEFSKETVKISNFDKYYQVEVYLVCPSCGKKKLITKMDVQ